QDRACLVCSTPTQVAHLGIDVCRACSVFYRFVIRAKKGNTYTCRTSTKRCSLGLDLNCKRCRLDKIERLLKKSGATVHLTLSNDQTSELSESPHDQIQMSSPSTSAKQSILTELPILERLKLHYRSMSRERLNSELHARSNPPHPLEISLDRGPFFPATFSTLTLSNRILLTALLDFGSNVFPGINKLRNKERWDISVNFFYRFRIFEGIYRAGIVFPDDLDRVFGGYTTWISPKYMENFYGDAPTGDKAGAQEHMKHSSMRLHEIHAARELLQRMNPRHEEFLVLIALMFFAFAYQFCSGDMPVSEQGTQVGERYREAIMKELHAFYREKLHLDDYATRLGELMLLLPVFDRTHDMKEHFEMLRLLDILPEDHFTYQLQKAD
ncbi:hypothetical protein PENTCL1PPCAC_14210, partial [Pristionchus entomophagus]